MLALWERRACTRQGDIYSPFPCQPGSIPWACCQMSQASSLQSSGQSGLGKSTLVNTLFKSQVSRKSSGWNREEKIPKTVEIKAIGHGKSQAAGVEAILMLHHSLAEDPSSLCKQLFGIRHPFLHGKLKDKYQF